jgi:hypothetical protein
LRSIDVCEEKPDGGVFWMRLVQVEVGGIQNYVFDGARLREWRGASALLDRVGRTELPALLDGEPVDLVRSGGGVAVMAIRPEAPEGTAPRIQKEVKQLFREHAPGVRLHASQVKASDEPVSDLLARLNYKTNVKQEQVPATDFGAELLGPMSRFCDSCGIRPAEKHRALGDEGSLVCTTCAEKGSYGAAVRNGEAPESIIRRFGTHIRNCVANSDYWPEVELISELVPDDLSALGNADPNGEIGLVLADGNALGRTIQEIGALDDYKSFSDDIAAAVEAAVFDTLSEHPPVEGTLPWEIVFLGGDDILILTTASTALPVAEGLAQEVEARSAEVVEPYGREFLSLGIGVAVARPHMPIRVLRRLAGELESRAKGLAYQQDTETHAIDFHRVTGEGSTTLDHIRNHVLRPARDYRSSSEAAGTRLTARPFTLDTLQDVRRLAGEWASADLPRSKMHTLRESLFESPAEAMRSWAHVVARAGDESRETWQSLASLVDRAARGSDLDLPWTTPSDGPAEAQERETYLLDVLDVLALEH